METPGRQTTITENVAGQSEELARAISAPLLFFYVLGDVLGSGIYALIGVMAAQVGGAFWTSFVIGVAAAMLTGFAYAELITKYPHAAGAAMYTGRAFDNRFFTFLVAFCMVAASLAATGALALAFSGYFLELLVALLSVPLLLAAVVFVVLLALINFRGISESVKVNLAMSITEITGLALVLVIGVVVFFAGDADLGRPFEFNEGGNPALLALAGATLAFFAMTGFENAANVAEEVQNPSRVYPRALLGGMASAGLIYLIIAFIASMVAPTGLLAGSEVALLEVVRQGFPAFPGWLFAIIACIAITNTCLVALITNSRIMYGMAREGVVPRIFARTHQSRRTPWVAIIFTTIIAVILIVGVGEEGVNTLASATVAFLLAVFTLVCLCALVLRRDSVPQEHYTAPIALLVLGVVVNVALLLYVLVTDFQGLVAGDIGLRESVVVVCVVMLLVGVGLYFVNNLAQRRLDPSRSGGGRDGRE
ncbi:MAG: APC family permease [Actinomycetota bacterium]|nr:APC family permease [Actinomycetota bacterium]